MSDMVPIPPTNPLLLLQTAMDKGFEPEKMGKLMDLAERWEANQAASNFGRAIADFQARCPLIFKGRAADRYAFASYDDIWKVAGPIAADLGISVSFSFPKTDSGQSLTIVHLRVGSHAEERPFSIPIADMQEVLKQIAAQTKITLAQAYGFWLSYQKRYSLCAALNIVVTNEDNDSAGDGAVISDEDVAMLTDLIKTKGANYQRFLKWASEAAKKEVADLHQVPVGILAKAIDMLHRFQAPKAKVTPKGELFTGQQGDANEGSLQ